MNRVAISALAALAILGAPIGAFAQDVITTVAGNGVGQFARQWRQP